LQAQLKLANRELETQAAEQRGVLAAIGSYEKRLAQLPVRQQEMAGLTRDYEISKANYKQLLEKKESAAMAKDMQMRQVGEKFTMLDPARIPEKPYSPNRPLFAGIGLAVSLMFGLAYAAVKEMKAGCLLGEWELPAHVPSIGRVPRIDFLEPGTRPGRLRVALVSSVAISLGLAVAVGLYFAWNRL
jgi:succinoglycan biosynthesis transport protein ExoP